MRDSRSFELSQGNVLSKSSRLGLNVTELKTPAVRRLAFPSLGQGSASNGSGAGSAGKKDWDDLLTTHVGEQIARTWNVEGKRMGKYNFISEDDRVDAGKATACCVTACGNFGLVGFERGRTVKLWNMQSGIRRREFKLPGVHKKAPPSKAKKEKHVTGIETDALNTKLVISTLAGKLHVSLCQTSA